MATIQVEPGSKAVTGRLVDGSTMSASGGGRIKGATHVVVKAGQKVRIHDGGVDITYSGGTSGRNVKCVSSTVLAYRL